jgi:uncharacterized protein YajQ (UPF0234 family)
MPTFDIVSKIDVQTLDNAINSVKREITTRFDFKASKTEIELDKKKFTLTILTENDMRMDQVEKIIIGQFVKNKLAHESLDFGKEHYASGNMLRKDVTIKQGIDKESAKKIIKAIKEAKFKVNTSIMDDQIRVDSKKIDDLQAVIAFCRQNNFDIPLQYINFK